MSCPGNTWVPVSLGDTGHCLWTGLPGPARPPPPPAGPSLAAGAPAARTRPSCGAGRKGLAVSGPRRPGPGPGSAAKRETEQGPRVPSSSPRGRLACREGPGRPASRLPLSRATTGAGPRDSWPVHVRGHGKGTESEEEDPAEQSRAEVGRRLLVKKEPGGELGGRMGVPQRSQQSNGENGLDEMMGGPPPSAQSPRPPCGRPP